MHGQARAAQRADAAEHEPPRLIETERAEHRLGVPGALPFRQNGPLQAVGERLGGEIEVREADLLATQARTRRRGIGVGRDEDLRGGDASPGGRATPERPRTVEGTRGRKSCRERVGLYV